MLGRFGYFCIDFIISGRLVDNGSKKDYSLYMPKGVYPRTDEMREKIRQGVKAHLPSTAFQPGVNSFPETKFQKGYTPYNKGTTGLSHGGARKGTKPWNYGLTGLKRNRVKGVEKDG